MGSHPFAGYLSTIALNLLPSRRKAQQEDPARRAARAHRDDE